MNKDIDLVYPEELVGGCISIYRNVWNNVDEIIQNIEDYSNSPDTSYKFDPATVLEGSAENKRTNYNLSLNNAAQDSSLMQNLCDDYYKLVFARSVGYNKHFDIQEPVYFNEMFNILKYQTGQKYSAHYDGGSSSGRTISPILYLNDDYEGGEIEFVNFNIKIKPEKGMLIIFPSSYPYAHVAHPVTSGTKYAIVSWLHDRPFDDLTQKALWGV
jgi:predicted 2-oxoglutarate/Fe(II)-dependent dioxygenase YbiX